MLSNIIARILPLLLLLLPVTAAAQADDGTGWVTVSTAHFRIHSNASPERAAEIAALNEREVVEAER